MYGHQVVLCTCACDGHYMGGVLCDGHYMGGVLCDGHMGGVLIA